jgi:serine protein kinase
MNLFNIYNSEYTRKKQDEMSLIEYLNFCKTDSSFYSSAAERMLKAIGEPDVIDTSLDPHLSRIFLNRTIKVYPALWS